MGSMSFLRELHSRTAASKGGDESQAQSWHELCPKSNGAVVRVASRAECGVGGQVWEAAAALVASLEQRGTAKDMQGSMVLELGAGTGALGLCIASLGAKHVVHFCFLFCLVCGLMCGRFFLIDSTSYLC